MLTFIIHLILNTLIHISFPELKTGYNYNLSKSFLNVFKAWEIYNLFSLLTKTFNMPSKETLVKDEALTKLVTDDVIKHQDYGEELYPSSVSLALNKDNFSKTILLFQLLIVASIIYKISRKFWYVLLIYPSRMLLGYFSLLMFGFDLNSYLEVVVLNIKDTFNIYLSSLKEYLTTPIIEEESVDPPFTVQDKDNTYTRNVEGDKYSYRKNLVNSQELKNRSVYDEYDEYDSEEESPLWFYQKSDGSINKRYIFGLLLTLAVIGFVVWYNYPSSDGTNPSPPPLPPAPSVPSAPSLSSLPLVAEAEAKGRVIPSISTTENPFTESMPLNDGLASTQTTISELKSFLNRLLPTMPENDYIQRINDANTIFIEKVKRSYISPLSSKGLDYYTTGKDYYNTLKTSISDALEYAKLKSHEYTDGNLRKIDELEIVNSERRDIIIKLHDKINSMSAEISNSKSTILELTSVKDETTKNINIITKETSEKIESLLVEKYNLTKLVEVNSSEINHLRELNTKALTEINSLSIEAEKLPLSLEKIQKFYFNVILEGLKNNSSNKTILLNLNPLPTPTTGEIINRFLLPADNITPVDNLMSSINSLSSSSSSSELTIRPSIRPSIHMQSLEPLQIPSFTSSITNIDITKTPIDRIVNQGAGKGLGIEGIQKIVEQEVTQIRNTFEVPKTPKTPSYGVMGNHRFIDETSDSNIIQISPLTTRNAWNLKPFLLNPNKPSPWAPLSPNTLRHFN